MAKGITHIRARKKTLEDIRESIKNVDSDAERIDLLWKYSPFRIDKWLGEPVSKRRRMHKKGSALDLFYVMGIVLAFALIVLIGFKVHTEFNTNIQASSDVDAHGKTASATLLTNYSGVMDKASLILLIGLCVVMVALASLVRVSPVFLPFFLIEMMFAIFIGGAISNVYDGFASDPTLSALANQLTVTGYVMQYLPIIIGVFSAILAVVMYKAWRDSA